MIVNGYQIKTKASLMGADLWKANLMGADLMGADLMGADLVGADLRYADLRGANLMYADLRHTDLRHTNLRYTDLSHTDMMGADLWGATLWGANIDFSAWPLWCGTDNVTIDEKQARQLLAHAFNPARRYWPGGLSKEQTAWLNEFRQIEEGGFSTFED